MGDREVGVLSNEYSIKSKRRKRLEWPKGNLKCNWNMIIMPHEDYVELVRGRMKYMYYFIALLFISFVIFPMIFIVLMKAPIVLIISFVPVFMILAIFAIIYFKWRIKTVLDPENNKHATVNWNNISKEMALSSIDKYIRKNHHDFNHEKIRLRNSLYKGPQQKYTLNNGIIINTLYSKHNNRAIGQVDVEYKPSKWKEALDVQLDIDEFLYQKNLVIKRI